MSKNRFLLIAFSLVLLVALALGLAASAPAVSAAPSSVTIAGDLQSELGCPGDWQPDCAATFLTYDANDDVWQKSFDVPAGNWQYKAALNGSWDVSYGKNTGGDNISLGLAGASSVKFYYDDKTHWVTDNKNSVIAVVAGSFQSELSCSGDWDPGCLRSWLEDPTGSGTYSFVTTALPAGSYEAKVTINESWDENYGQGGAPGGANIPFTVPVDHAQVTFLYDPSSHVLTIRAGHALDNNVEWDGLKHDSRDLLYRTPGGAVTAGASVKIRFRTFHNDVDSVKLRVFDINANAQQIISMKVAAADVSCYQDNLANESCDFWEATLASPQPDNLWYRFIVTDGTSTAYYADNTPALDGGLGQPTSNQVDNSWALMFYDPAFNSPAWARSSVIYQVFPDRFRNGDTANDPKTGDIRYDDPVYRLPWGTLPEGYCNNYADASSNCPWRFGAPPNTSGTVEQPRGRDYMGGDLKGVDQKLDYLKNLGVTTIYFNPIFDSGSNHGYDTQDYTKVDPYFGSQADWDKLVSDAGSRGIRIVLDGVFNHMSSDSPFFDRYGHYSQTGACESATALTRPDFYFRPPAAGEPSPCAPSTPGGKDTYYTGWFGFDSIPVINKSVTAVQQYFITNPDSITRRWLNGGATGWRMDVMGDASFPNGYWESFRTTVKQTRSDALIIGELWQKDSTLLRFLRGDRADTTMNYRLRDAVVGFFAPGSFDSKGFADSGHPLKASELAARLASIREDYPDAAYFSLMNLLDSHDTERVRWTLTPGTATAADKEQNAANVATGKLAQRLASLIQFSLAGEPTVYYGDEVGMTGNTDPDDRRTYPWTDTGGSPDSNMLVHYKALTSLRKANDVLVNGDFRVLLADDSASSIAFGRKTGTQAGVVVVNWSDASQTLNIPVAGYIHDGVALTVQYAVGNETGAGYTVKDGALSVTLAAKSGMVLLSGKVDLTPPLAPFKLTAYKEGNAQVSLAWADVPGAACYNVYESPLSGGGWVKALDTCVQSTTATIKIPYSAAPVTGLNNAQIYYFIVRAVDAVGNESGPSNEATAMPHLTTNWGNVQWPPTITQTISAVNPTENVYGQVFIDGVTNQPGQAPTLRAQLGYGPAGTNPATNAKWVWIEATFNTDAGNNDEFKAQMLPDKIGTYDYVYRYTTTNGRDWLYGDLNGTVPAGQKPSKPGKMTVVASSDTTPPAAPANLRVTAASPSAIDLAWDAVTGDATMYGYEVYRSEKPTDGYVKIALVTDTKYTDKTVVQDHTYYYVVLAVDTSFNLSDHSNRVSAKAQVRTVTVTFSVTVPDSTDGTGKSVYIAGTLSLLNGGLPDWNPGATVLTRVDATHWTITLTGLEQTQIQYKYTLGDWDHVEKDNACGEISNRMLTLTYGTDGKQTVNDTVQNWRNVSPCGN